MAATELTVTIRHRDGAVILDLVGDIDRDADAPLETAYGQAATGENLLLNFTDVGYINSTGIAVIVGLLARARAEHREVGAYGLSDHYQTIFNITRLSDFMGIYPDERSAVGDAPAANGTDVRAARGGGQ